MRLSECFLIVLTLLFLTPLFYYLPNAILASVIMVAVFGLIDIKEAVHLWHANRADFFMLLVTFVATLALGIEQGIGVGVVLSLAMVIYSTTRPHVAVLGKVPGTTSYRNVERFPEAETLAGAHDLCLHAAAVAAGCRPLRHFEFAVDVRASRDHGFKPVPRRTS